MTIGGGSSYLYVLTQWGLRPGAASRTRPTRAPSLRSSSARKAARATAASSRSCATATRAPTRWTWRRRPDGDRAHDLGLAALQPGRAADSGLARPARAPPWRRAVMTFGHQIDLPSDVPLGSRDRGRLSPSSRQVLRLFPDRRATASRRSTSRARTAAPTPAKPFTSVTPSAGRSRRRPACGWPRRTSSPRATTSTSWWARRPARPGSSTVAEINANNGNLTEIANVPMVKLRHPDRHRRHQRRDLRLRRRGHLGMNVYKFTPPSTLQST